jgi:hypothetical protein
MTCEFASFFCYAPNFISDSAPAFSCLTFYIYVQYMYKHCTVCTGVLLLLSYKFFTSFVREFLLSFITKSLTSYLLPCCLICIYSVS